MDIGSISSLAGNGDMTISQIRDTTDRMAVDGKLTVQQQMALIGDGLQDLNASDPSYQPAETIQVGYSRSDTGSYNMVKMMNGAAEFADSMGNAQTGAVYQGIAQAFQQYESGSSVNVSV